MSFPGVFGFSDFRACLLAWYEAERQLRGRYTKADVSRALGLPNTRNYFSAVLGGKEVSDTFLERFVALMELGREEGRYFRALVQFQQAETPEGREDALELLVSLNRSPRNELAPERMEYFRHWWHGAVRALLDTGDFGDEPERIGKSLVPVLTPGQVRDSLSLLKRLGLVDRDGRGFWKPTDQVVSTPEGLREELVLGLQLEQLDLVRKSLLKRDAPKRMVSTNMISVSLEGHRHLLQVLEKARSEVRSIVHKDDRKAERVCQVVLALVPLTPDR